MNELQEEVILALQPLNYRKVVAFNFDKVTNQEFWNEAILDFYDFVMQYRIHESFIGIRVNLNETNDFMLKLSVRLIDIEEIDLFYQICCTHAKVVSFYYECNEVVYHYAGLKEISILINGFKMFLTPNSFTQANHEMGNILYSKINDIIKPNKKLIVYGRNSFHIASQLNSKFKEVICINPCPISYADGLKCLKFHNFQWSTVKTKDLLVNFINGSSDDTTVIMSPGRNGYCLFDKIDPLKLKNKQFLYITCNEKSFQRDIKNNFNIKKNIMIELFPGTEYNEHIIELV